MPKQLLKNNIAYSHGIIASPRPRTNSRQLPHSKPITIPGAKKVNDTTLQWIGSPDNDPEESKSVFWSPRNIQFFQPEKIASSDPIDIPQATATNNGEKTLYIGSPNSDPAEDNCLLDATRPSFLQRG